MMNRLYSGGQRRQLFSVALKQFGQLQTPQIQHRSIMLVTTRSSPSPSSLSKKTTYNNNYCDHENFDSVFVRQFSDMSLRRPPTKQDEIDVDSKRKWRSHAVSLEFGNYRDDYDEDYTELDGNPNSSLTTNGTNNSSATSAAAATSTWHEEEVELADRVREIQQEEDERRKRWLNNAKAPIRRSIIDERGRAYGRGGRKTASARVWIQPGFGNVVVNRKDFVDYFERTSDRELILEALAATETLGRFDVTATVEGGGLRGQAGAIRHGLARALNHYNPDVYRPPLKRLGYLTRDPRKVERKKIGHLKARKKPQWVKR